MDGDKTECGGGIKQLTAGFPVNKVPMPMEPESEIQPARSARPGAGGNPVIRALQDFASSVPPTGETLSGDPVVRAKQIVTHASLKAAAVSAGLALPPGPAGLLTVLPDLVAIWKLQQQMVADIAGCFGKQALLSPQLMVYCMFRHGAAMVMRDIVVRAGERLLVRQASLRVIQNVLQKVGVKVTQRLVGKSITRWLPVLGPVLVGGYALFDTRQVGRTAIDTFRRDIGALEGPGEDPACLV